MIYLKENKLLPLEASYLKGCPVDLCVYGIVDAIIEEPGSEIGEQKYWIFSQKHVFTWKYNSRPQRYRLIKDLLPQTRDGRNLIEDIDAAYFYDNKLYILKVTWIN